MKSYIEIFESGGIPEKYVKRLNNDPNNAGIVEGLEFIAFDKAKEILNSLTEKVKKYVQFEKNISKLPKISPNKPNKYPDIGTSIASRGYIYRPFEVN